MSTATLDTAARSLAARLGPTLFIVSASALLVATSALAAMSGAFEVPLGTIVASIGRRLGFDAHVGDPTIESVLWSIRFPRVLLGLVVGASLGCAGAAMQGVFTNPLAEPGIVGVSSGAVLGAVAAIVSGAVAMGPWAVPAAAFGGGMAAAVSVYLMARTDGRAAVVTLVLTGIAVNAMVGALIGFATYLSDDAELRNITFWTLGSLAGATWSKVALIAPLAIVGITICVALSRRLDLLALGDAAAQHVGIGVEGTRLAVLACVAVLTAGAVSVSGTVGFIGLVVPHVVRMVVGPSHRWVLSCSAITGATVLVAADLVARTIAAPAELPLGVLTALIGGPFFVWLLRRSGIRQGGWT